MPGFVREWPLPTLSGVPGNVLRESVAPGEIEWGPGGGGSGPWINVGPVVQLSTPTDRVVIQSGKLSVPSTGLGSEAFGLDAIAAGDDSYAAGPGAQTTALADHATALGPRADANAPFSLAAGWESDTFGFASTALGGRAKTWTKDRLTHIITPKDHSFVAGHLFCEVNDSYGGGGIQCPETSGRFAQSPPHWTVHGTGGQTWTPITDPLNPNTGPTSVTVLSGNVVGGTLTPGQVWNVAVGYRNKEGNGETLLSAFVPITILPGDNAIIASNFAAIFALDAQIEDVAIYMEDVPASTNLYLNGFAVVGGPATVNLLTGASPAEIPGYIGAVSQVAVNSTAGAGQGWNLDFAGGDSDDAALPGGRLGFYTNRVGAAHTLTLAGFFHPDDGTFSVPGAGSGSERFGLNATADADASVALGQGAIAGAVGATNVVAVGSGMTVLGGNRLVGIGQPSIDQLHTTQPSFDVVVVGGTGSVAGRQVAICGSTGTEGISGDNICGLGYQIGAEDTIFLGQTLLGTGAIPVDQPLVLIGGSERQPALDVWFGAGVEARGAVSTTIHGTRADSIAAFAAPATPTATPTAGFSTWAPGTYNYFATFYDGVGESAGSALNSFTLVGGDYPLFDGFDFDVHACGQYVYIEDAPGSGVYRQAQPNTGTGTRRLISGLGPERYSFQPTIEPTRNPADPAYTRTGVGGALNIAGGYGRTAGDTGGNLGFYTGRTGTADVDTLAGYFNAADGSFSVPGAGTDSERFGFGATVSGTGGVAFGRGTSVTGAGGIAIGYNVTAGANEVTLGDDTTTHVLFNCGPTNGTLFGVDASARIGWWGATPTLQHAEADLVNNVTSGGVANTIADFTDLVVYANDAATIRNDIFQLAQKLYNVVFYLRLYGFFG